MPGAGVFVLTAPLCSPLPTPAQLNKAFQAEESPGVIYCISMQWFREWEAFVKGKDSGEWSRGPALRLPLPPAGGPRAVAAGSVSGGGAGPRPWTPGSVPGRQVLVPPL